MLFLNFYNKLNQFGPFSSKKTIYYKFILFVLLAKEKDPTLFKRIENIKALGRDIWKPYINCWIGFDA